MYLFYSTLVFHIFFPSLKKKKQCQKYNGMSSWIKTIYLFGAIPPLNKLNFLDQQNMPKFN